MARLKDLVESVSDAFRVDPRKLLFDETNPRDYTSQETIDHIRWLADNIKQHGVKVAIEIRMEDDKIYVTDGGCRVRAALIAIKEGADLATIPAVPEPRYTSVEDRLLSKLLRNTGKTFSALEQAEVFHGFLVLGWSEEKVAEKTNYSLGHVTNMLRLRACAPELKQSVTEGQIAATEAVKLIRSYGEDAPEIAAMAIEEAHQNGKAKATATDIAAVLDEKPKRTRRDEILIPRSKIIAFLRELHQISQERGPRSRIKAFLESYDVPLREK